MSRVKIVYNRLPQIRKDLPQLIENRLENAAQELRKQLIEQLHSGMLIQSDTQALAQSLFVQTPQNSDYAARLQAAAVAYLSNSSVWLAPVRENVTPEAYEKPHFYERVASEDALPQEKDVHRVAVASMLAYAAFWEYGHDNEFTKRYEHRPWMSPVAFEWAFSHLAKQFEDLLK